MTRAFGEIMRDVTRLGGEEVQPSLPCRYCGTSAPYAALAMFGARCRACYDQYLRLGYSGAAPAPQAKQAGWVAAAAAEAQRRAAGRSNAFTALSERMQQHQAQRQAIKGATSDDEVNAMLSDASR